MGASTLKIHSTQRVPFLNHPHVAWAGPKPGSSAGEVPALQRSLVRQEKRKRQLGPQCWSVPVPPQSLPGQCQGRAGTSSSHRAEKGPRSLCWSCCSVPGCNPPPPQGQIQLSLQGGFSHPAKAQWGPSPALLRLFPRAEHPFLRLLPAATAGPCSH